MIHLYAYSEGMGEHRGQALWCRTVISAIQRAEAGRRSQVQDHPGLQNEFKANLGNSVRLSLKMKSKGAGDRPVMEHFA